MDLFYALCVYLCSLCLGNNLQVMYGGRVIDSFDRRILTSYMDEYFGDFLFYTYRLFHFFYNKVVDYKIPPHGTKMIYVGPSLFSLLYNISYYLHHAQLYPVICFRGD